MSPEEDKFVQSDTVLATAVGDSSVVMTDANLSAYFGVHEVGAAVWRELAEPKTISEVVQTLMENFHVDSNVCWRETSDFILVLTERGLLNKQTAG